MSELHTKAHVRTVQHGLDEQKDDCSTSWRDRVLVYSVCAVMERGHRSSSHPCLEP
jgi:hypothetical protein